MTECEEKITLVTGAGRGIGQAVALVLDLVKARLVTGQVIKVAGGMEMH